VFLEVLLEYLLLLGVLPVFLLQSQRELLLTCLPSLLVLLLSSQPVRPLFLAEFLLVHWMMTPRQKRQPPAQLLRFPLAHQLFRRAHPPELFSRVKIITLTRLALHLLFLRGPLLFLPELPCERRQRQNLMTQTLSLSVLRLLFLLVRPRELLPLFLLVLRCGQQTHPQLAAEESLILGMGGSLFPVLALFLLGRGVQNFTHMVTEKVKFPFLTRAGVRLNPLFLPALLRLTFLEHQAFLLVLQLALLPEHP
jgi:hypothetical protein